MSHAALSAEPQPFKRPEGGGQVSAIVEAAEGCFSRGGYAGASMREIAEHAGVSKSLLHYHFQSKEHLFVEVQIRFYERLGERIAAAVAPIASGERRGLAAFDALFEVLRSSEDLATQAELWAGALADPKLRLHVVRLREFFRGMLVVRIHEILGPDAGRLPISAEAAADLIWATLNGLGIEAAFGEPSERIERAIATLRVLTALLLAQSAASAYSQAIPRRATGENDTSDTDASDDDSHDDDTAHDAPPTRERHARGGHDAL
jgi:AcrR family transcriptional regulator